MTTTTNPHVYQASATYTLRPQTCCECGVLFGMEVGFDNQRRDDHRRWFCPNGHSQHYTGKTEAQKLTEQLEAARSLATRERERRATAERSASAYKGQVTKVKRRVGKGVCPCCTRTVRQLADHMAEKHPDYADGGL